VDRPGAMVSVLVSVERWGMFAGCGGLRACVLVMSTHQRFLRSMHPFSHTKRALDGTELSYFSLAALKDPRVGAADRRRRPSCRLGTMVTL
jgi:hypothetical protein